MKLPSLLMFALLAAITTMATAADSRNHVKEIERGLTCMPSKNLDKALTALKIPSDVGDQIVPAPEGLTVFGITVSQVAFTRDGDEGYFRAFFPAGITLEQVVKAAALKLTKTQMYRRSTKTPEGMNGTLYASMEETGVVLKCVIN